MYLSVESGAPRKDPVTNVGRVAVVSKPSPLDRALTRSLSTRVGLTRSGQLVLE